MADTKASVVEAEEDPVQVEKIRGMIDQYIACDTNELQVAAITYLMENKLVAKPFYTMKFGELVATVCSGDAVAMRQATCLEILGNVLYPPK